MTSTYVIGTCDGEGALEFAKIGKARDVQARLKKLQTANPKRLVLIWECNRDVETALHKFYQNQRIDGEWFRLSDDHIRDLSSIAAYAYFLHTGWDGMNNTIRCTNYAMMHKRLYRFRVTCENLDLWADDDQVLTVTA